MAKLAPTGTESSKIYDDRRPRALSFYLVLIFFVVPLWSVSRLAWLWMIYTIATGRILSLSLTEKFFTLYAIIEVWFSLYHRQLVKQIKTVNPNAPAKVFENVHGFARVIKAGLGNYGSAYYDNMVNSPLEPMANLQFDDPRAADFRLWIQNWFGKVSWSSLRRREISEWLHWTAYNAPLPPDDEITGDHKWVVESGLKQIEQRSGQKIPEGSDPNVKPILLTLGDMRIKERPFVWYALVLGLHLLLQRRYTRKYGAEFGSYRGLEYMVRTPKGWNKDSGARPVIFIHGLGLGIVQYAPFLEHMIREFSDRPILVVLQPHVSQRIFHPRFMAPMGRHETADCLAGLLEYMGWADKRQTDDFEFFEESGSSDDASSPTSESRKRKGVTILSHSNGSYAHAWMLKCYPSMVTASCFVDPVTFCSWEGDVCWNFVYKRCATGFQLVMRYFIANELGVANVLQRHYDWASNALWFEEIPNARDERRTKFIFGGRDNILNGPRVHKYLSSHGVKDGLWYDPKGKHGQPLMVGKSGHKEVLRWLKALR